MSGSAWAGVDGHEADGGDHGATREDGDESLPAVQHERAVSLVVVRLPGELTGSGTTLPYPAPSPARCRRLRRDSPQARLPTMVPRLRAPRQVASPDSARCPRGPGGPLPRPPERPRLVGPAASRPNFQPVSRRCFVSLCTRSESVRSSHSHTVTPATGADQADSTCGRSTGRTSRSGGTRPPSASTSSARCSSSSKVSSGGGPSSTVTTQSWQASPRTTQVSQSIRRRSCQERVTGTTDSRPGRVAARRVAAQRRDAAASSASRVDRPRAPSRATSAATAWSRGRPPRRPGRPARPRPGRGSRRRRSPRAG